VSTAAIIPTLNAQQQAFALWQHQWAQTARPNQIPELVSPAGFVEMGYLAGRGFGKTRVGAEWLGRAVYLDPDGYDSAVIAPTYQDVKFTCFEGESGLLSVIPPALIKAYNKSDLVIEMYNVTGGVSSIRGFTAEKPERLRGPQHVRIWCFIAGTMVATPAGNVPIESLRPGDTVLTRAGPRCVVANSVRHGAEVGEVAFANGAKLVGTPDHPVYLPSGWTRLDRLQVGDTACVLGVLSGAASAGTATAKAITSAPTRATGSARFAFTAPCGKTLMGLFLMATTSITRTMIAVITASRIWSAYRTASTARTTFETRGPVSATGAAPLPSSSLAAAAALPSNGSDPTPTPDAGAATRSKPMNAASNSAVAGSAGSLSDHGWGTTAVSVASTWQPRGRQSVYCLKVEGEPEYFANGILVHNCDELAAWMYDDVWDMAMMGLRLGQHPQVLWTTTPKPKELVRKLVAKKPGRVLVTGATYDNRANLPDSFFDQLAQYEGTTLGRQELYGELIDPEESGIVKRSQFRLWPHDKPLPRFDLIVMSLDTAFTEKTMDKRSGDPDPTACSVWGVFHHEKRNNVMLLDCWEEHLGLPDLMRKVRRELNTSYGDDDDTAVIKPLFGSSKPMTSGRKPDILLIEDKGSGISLRQMLEREGIEAYAYNPGRADKLTRLHIVSPIFARKMVWLPESAKHPGRPRNWVDPLLHQLCSYTGPGSIKHDDFVDSVSQAFRLMMDKRLLDAVQARKDEIGPPPKPVSNPYAA
jgi:predicted phage terminase large subunit-like protein